MQHRDSVNHYHCAPKTTGSYWEQMSGPISFKGTKTILWQSLIMHPNDIFACTHVQSQADKAYWDCVWYPYMPWNDNNIPPKKIGHLCSMLKITIYSQFNFSTFGCTLLNCLIEINATFLYEIFCISQTYCKNTFLSSIVVCTSSVTILRED